MTVESLKSQKKIKEDEFELSGETFKKILDNSFDEIFVVDKDGRVIYVNRACERHYGMRVSDVLGKSVFELQNNWSPLSTPLVLKEKRRVTVEQNSILGNKLITTTTPVFDEKDNIEFLIMNCRDATQLEDFKQDLEITRKLLEENINKNTKKQKKNMPEISEIITRSKEMKEVIRLAEQVASVDSTVLILGESGTGKGVLARHIHKMSERSDGPFMAINCAAIPEDLLESELFGYSPGAFTGANKNGKAGLIELANNGTLFLDEIGEISPTLQAKILQVVQERKFIPVGGKEIKESNGRIIAATNRNLMEMVKEGKFRGDLYYRLNVIEIEIPPLRERPEDIVMLVYYFMKHFDKKYKVSHQVSERCLDILTQYTWPGNIRELEHLMERLVVTVRETIIKPEHLPKIFSKNFEPKFDISFPTLVPLDGAIEEVEKSLIQSAYSRLRSSYKIAKALNISQSRAHRLIKKYIIDEEEFNNETR